MRRTIRNHGTNGVLGPMSRQMARSRVLAQRLSDERKDRAAILDTPHNLIVQQLE
jgi:hypothetical protein